MVVALEKIDSDAVKVVQRLVRHGHAAYLVGGCVRDLLLARTPKDFDVATSATPTDAKRLFRNCRIIGRRFRLAHIFFGSKIIETSTFRANPRDGEDGDDEGEILIRRDNVFGTAEEDARRRDFTINGLFYDLARDEVIDYVGGLDDLRARLVRTIGDPDIRFREDPVRILRAIKFAARLGFVVEPATYAALLAQRGEIEKCPAPRVGEELYRLLRGGAAARSIELCIETGVLALLIPELDHRLGAFDVPQVDQAAPVQRFWALCDALDDLVRERGLVPSNGSTMALLAAPFCHEALTSERAPDAGATIDEALEPIARGFHASRRDAERARQLLLAQRRIATSSRRGRAQPLTRRDYYVDALLLRRLNLVVDGASAEEIEPIDALIRAATPPAVQASLQHLRRPEADLAEAETGNGVEGADLDSATASSAPSRPRRRRRRGGARRRGDASPLSGGA